MKQQHSASNSVYQDDRRKLQDDILKKQLDTHLLNQFLLFVQELDDNHSVSINDTINKYHTIFYDLYSKGAAIKNPDKSLPLNISQFILDLVELQIIENKLNINYPKLLETIKLLILCSGNVFNASVVTAKNLFTEHYSQNITCFLIVLLGAHNIIYDDTILFCYTLLEYILVCTVDNDKAYKQVQWENIFNISSQVTDPNKPMVVLTKGMYVDFNPVLETIIDKIQNKNAMRSLEIKVMELFMWKWTQIPWGINGYTFSYFYREYQMTDLRAIFKRMINYKRFGILYVFIRSGYLFEFHRSHSYMKWYKYDAVWYEYFLKDRESRKHFKYAILGKDDTRRQLLYPLHGESLMFVLLRRKERKLIQFIFKKEKENVNKLLNLTDENGNDLLLYICGVSGKTQRIINFLIENGADITSTNNKNQTIIDRTNSIRYFKMTKFNFKQSK